MKKLSVALYVTAATTVILSLAYLLVALTLRVYLSGLLPIIALAGIIFAGLGLVLLRKSGHSYLELLPSLRQRSGDSNTQYPDKAKHDAVGHELPKK